MEKGGVLKEVFRGVVLFLVFWEIQNVCFDS